MKISYEGKVALVTGASRGIGQAIALQLGQLGATVVGTATSEKGANDISNTFEANGIKGYGVVMNLTQPESMVDTFNTISKDLGVVQILVNNAGVTEDNLLLRMKDEQWQKVIDTNLTGAYHLCKASLKGMMKARWGRIVQISSVVGVSGNAGQANYAASKAGLIGFSKSLAQEVGSRGITVNIVAPGMIETDMTDVLSQEQRDAFLGKVPLGRLGQVQDIADAVAFLASDAAGYITGETIHVNGGMLMP